MNDLFDSMGQYRARLIVSAFAFLAPLLSGFILSAASPGLQGHLMALGARRPFAALALGAACCSVFILPELHSNLATLIGGLIMLPLGAVLLILGLPAAAGAFGLAFGVPPAQPYLATALGSLVLVLLLQVPRHGGLLWIIAAAWGLGIALLTLFGARAEEAQALEPKALLWFWGVAAGVAVASAPAHRILNGLSRRALAAHLAADAGHPPAATRAAEPAHEFPWGDSHLRPREQRFSAPKPGAEQRYEALLRDSLDPEVRYWAYVIGRGSITRAQLEERSKSWLMSDGLRRDFLAKVDAVSASGPAARPTREQMEEYGRNAGELTVARP